MWLIDNHNLTLHEFHGSLIPSYAILSHTWSDDEVLFHELQNDDRESVLTLRRYHKIREFCKTAISHGFHYGWVDSVCIDKRSSAELSEAINSMFKWYNMAKLCIVYLVDVPPIGGVRQWVHRETFERSRWFRRGWCLQELIASQVRIFYAEDWSVISRYTLGLNPDDTDLEDLISKITGINTEVLQNISTLKSFCIAERMSWAARRETTRPEDRAYSLMGLFGVTMPILYGEGMEDAFARLLDEIMKTSFDQTIFAWRGPYRESGLLPPSPDVYKDTPTLRLWRPDYLSPYSMTNTGLQIRPFIFHHKQGDIPGVYAALQCNVENVERDGWKIVFVELKQVENTFCTVNGVRCKAYRRINCNKWFEFSSNSLVGNPAEILLVLEDKHKVLIDTSIEMHRKTGRSDLREMAWNDETTEERLKKEQEDLQGRLTDQQESLHDQIMREQNSLRDMITKEQNFILDRIGDERNKALDTTYRLDSRIRQLDEISHAISKLNSRIDERAHQLDGLTNVGLKVDYCAQQLDLMTNAISGLDSRVDSGAQQLVGLRGSITSLDERTRRLIGMSNTISDLDARMRQLNEKIDAVWKGDLH